MLSSKWIEKINGHEEEETNKKYITLTIALPLHGIMWQCYIKWINSFSQVFLMPAWDENETATLPRTRRTQGWVSLREQSRIFLSSPKRNLPASRSWNFIRTNFYVFRASWFRELFVCCGRTKTGIQTNRGSRLRKESLTAFLCEAFETLSDDSKTCRADVKLFYFILVL